MENYVEVWQRGAIPGVPPLLQPVAHALLQVGEEAHRIMQEFPDELLWKRPGNVAPPAFHLQHIRGVINRLFTYARKEQLTREQMDALLIEGKEEKIWKISSGRLTCPATYTFHRAWAKG